MKATLFFVLLLSTSLSAQTTYTIKVKSTQEPVPYVNIFVEGENAGTTADENGVFVLPQIKEDKILIFSAIGFEDLKLPVKDLSPVIFLIPSITELEPVVITAPKKNLELSIDKFKKSQTSHSYGNRGYPQMTGKFFSYKPEYENTPYISKIRILTRSEIDSATFNIRLYLPGKDGKPGAYLHDENILSSAKKGKKITEVDVSHLNIIFPESGFFVAYEWLIIEPNKYEYKHSIEGQAGRYDGISYEPAIFTLPAETASNNWRYSFGNWYNGSRGSTYENSVLAVELILSN